MSIISRIFKPGSYDPSQGVGSGTMSEWFPSYASRYPQNNVLASTPSGHLIELDDTPGAERIHLYHRSGSHIEMRPDGAVKYKTVNARQDVTIGDHEIIIQGDYRITTDGGMQLNVRNGKLIIEAGAGVEVNATGGDITLKAQKGNINLDAQKISLNSLYVDIGKGSPPYLSLPAGINSLFGVPIPMISLRVPKFNMALLGIFGVVAEIGLFVERSLSLTKRMAYFKTIIDPASGDPQISEIEQPEEIPLSSPGLYRDNSPAAARLRDRQLDTPEDVGNTETYSAHLNINAEMGDYDKYPEAKKFSGQIFRNDEAIPAAAPLPYRSFEVGHGKISCELDSLSATGTNTKFTEELVVGQRVVVAGQVMIVGSIINDTSLLWQENWPVASVSNKTIFAAQLRPFREFFHRYNYDAEFPLGDSGLVLKNLMVNFVAPVIDKPTTPFYAETTGGGGTYEPNADGNRPDPRPRDNQKPDPQDPTDDQGIPEEENGDRMKLTNTEKAVILQFESTFPLAMTGDEASRNWTHRLCEQLASSFPSAGWGHKSASPDRPHSADSIALRTPFICWDIVGNSGTPDATLQLDGDSIDITGQTFEPVTPVNHLHA